MLNYVKLFYENIHFITPWSSLQKMIQFDWFHLKSSYLQTVCG